MTDAASPEPGFDPADAASYRFWIDDHVRFADLDPLGHANNSAISTFFESARVALFDRAMGEFGGEGNPSVVIVRLVIDFRAELRYAERVRIGLRVTRFGRTSVVLAGGVFRDDACIASSEAVCVMFDLKERKPVEVSEDLRRQLAELA